MHERHKIVNINSISTSTQAQLRPLDASLEIAGSFLPKQSREVWAKDYKQAVREDKIDTTIVSEPFWKNAQLTIDATKKYPPANLDNIQKSVFMHYAGSWGQDLASGKKPTDARLNELSGKMDRLLEFVQDRSNIKQFYP